MKFLSCSFYDEIARQLVGVYDDKLGRIWFANDRWALFRSKGNKMDNMMDWRIQTTDILYSEEDVALAKSEGKIVKFGDVMATDVFSIGPIGYEENHYTGVVMTINLKQAHWLQDACEHYEKIKPFPIQYP